MMTSSFTDQLAALYELKKIPFVIHKGVFWHLYNRMVEPRYPHAQRVDISSEEAQQIRKKLNGMLIRWTGAFEDKKTNPIKDWYAIACFKNIDIEQQTNKRRKDLKKALSNCQIKRVDAVYIAMYGYDVYKKAHQRYQHNKNQFVTADIFKREIRLERSFEDLIHYFGVFIQDQLVAYAKVYIYGKEEANYNVTKFDPAFLKYRIGDALAYHRNQYYLDQKRVAYVCAGARTVEHPTKVQDFYCQKYNFQKRSLPLYIQYGPQLHLPMQLMRPFRNILAKTHPKLKALLKLDQYKNG